MEAQTVQAGKRQNSDVKIEIDIDIIPIHFDFRF
jgi:hypothetical protein